MANPAAARYTDEKGLEVKKCTKCGMVKHVSEFRIRGRNVDNLETQCKACCVAKERSWYANNKEIAIERDRKRKLKHPKRHRKIRLMRAYGISIEQFEHMRKKQGYMCAICAKEENKCRYKTLCVDHCHTTGKVRALLCDKCNVGLGHFGESIERLSVAASYLQSHMADANA